MSTDRQHSIADQIANGVLMQNLVERGLFKDTNECKEFVIQNEERIKELIDQTNHIVKEQRNFRKSSRKSKEVLPTEVSRLDLQETFQTLAASIVLDVLKKHRSSKPQ